MNNRIPLNVNTLYLITSPRSGEEGFARRIIESVNDVLNEVGGGELQYLFKHGIVNNQDDFISALDRISLDIIGGMKPMIHFDMHGSQEKGLEVGPTGEFIDWQKVYTCLRILNEQLNNELVVVITACNGLHLIKSISVEKAAPFLCLIAPDEEISFGHIEVKVPLFYREFFVSGSLHNACKKLGKEFTYFSSATLLFYLMIEYFKSYCKGVGGRARREALLTEIMNTSLGKYPENISTYRKQIKQYITPSQQALDFFTSRFLLGKASEIKINDLLDEIDKA